MANPARKGGECHTKTPTALAGGVRHFVHCLSLLPPPPRRDCAQSQQSQQSGCRFRRLCRWADWRSVDRRSRTDWWWSHVGVRRRGSWYRLLRWAEEGGLGANPTTGPALPVKGVCRFAHDQQDADRRPNSPLFPCCAHLLLFLDSGAHAISLEWVIPNCLPSVNPDSLKREISEFTRNTRFAGTLREFPCEMIPESLRVVWCGGRKMLVNRVERRRI
jgi:hypothetical protein